MEVIVAAAICCLKKTVKRFVQCHVFAQAAKAPVINIQSKLRTLADCVKMFHSAVLFGGNGNSYITSK